ncbi:MAG: cytochrome c biogenesis protein CcsA [Terriglobia bacterium]
MKKSSMLAHAVLTAVWIVLALYLIFIYAPTDVNQGNVYRIMYVHISSGWTAFLGYFLVFLGSVWYLAKRSQTADDVAHAAGEVGFVFCSCILITGSLWAKPIWGIWWTWDARLTLSFVLWLLFVGYLLVRSFFLNPGRAALLSAVVGIVGFVDVPLDYMAIRWWRTQHPQPVIMGGPNSGLAPSMLLTLLVSWGAFLCLFFFLLRYRVSLIRAQRELSLLRRELAVD